MKMAHQSGGILWLIVLIGFLMGCWEQLATARLEYQQQQRDESRVKERGPPHQVEPPVEGAASAGTPTADDHLGNIPPQQLLGKKFPSEAREWSKYDPHPDDDAAVDKETLQRHREEVQRIEVELFGKEHEKADQHQETLRRERYGPAPTPAPADVLHPDVEIEIDEESGEPYIVEGGTKKIHASGHTTDVDPEEWLKEKQRRKSAKPLTADEPKQKQEVTEKHQQNKPKHLQGPPLDRVSDYLRKQQDPNTPRGSLMGFTDSSLDKPSLADMIRNRDLTREKRHQRFASRAAEHHKKMDELHARRSKHPGAQSPTEHQKIYSKTQPYPYPHGPHSTSKSQQPHPTHHHGQQESASQSKSFSGGEKDLESV